jgi:hypothetical protein
VRNFLRNHENESYTAYEVSRLIGVDVKDVEGLVSMDLIRSGTPAYAHDTEMNSKKRETEKEIKKEKEMEKEIEKEIEKEKTPLTKRKNFNSVYLSHKKKP